MIRFSLGHLLSSLFAGMNWAGMPEQPQPQIPSHDHPFDIPDTPTLVALAEALGGGSYPGLGSGQNDTMPWTDSVAPGFPLNLPFLVPANTVKQQAVKLTFQPQAYRTYVSPATHNHTGDTHSIHTHDVVSIGYSHGSTGNEQQTHFHLLPWEDNPSGVGQGAVNWETGSGLPGGNALYSAAFQFVGHIMRTGVDSGAQGDHAHAGSSAHAVHDHSYNDKTSLSNSSTGSTGTPTGVQEGTSPDAMHVMVDGTDVTSQLGGPFTSAQTELDITPYVANGTGLHTVQVTTSTNLGRIAGFVRNKAIVNNLGTAN